MRVRYFWFARICWLLLVLVACGDQQPALTAAAIPPGWQTVEQEGIRLALPPTWEVVSSEESDVSGSLEAAATANPQLNALLSETRAAFDTGQLRLVAYDFDPEHQADPFTTNVSIGVVPSDGAELKQIRAANLAQLKSNAAFSDLQAADATVAGLAAVHFSYGMQLNDLGGEPLPLRVDQYLLVHQDNQYIVTFSTAKEQHEARSPVFKQVLDTLRVGEP